MFGKNRRLIPVQCSACQRWRAVRADPDDVGRVVSGKALVQDALSYLDPFERELLLLSGLCERCWTAMIPSDPAAYS